MTKQYHFQNKVVWITGASSGMGAALAKALAPLGCHLVLSARSREKLREVAEACNVPDSHILIVPFDLEQSADCEALVQTVVSKYGRIDFLFNMGGVSQRALAGETPLELDRKIMEVNYFGTIALTKSVLPVMLRQKSGHLVATSSIVGKFGFPLRSAYSASKHALHGFFETVRAENAGQGIRVTILIPGRVQTNISYSALKSNGMPHGELDEGQQSGITAEQSANQIIKAIVSNKKEALIGGRELMMVHIRRWFPALAYRIVRKIKPT